MTLYVYVNECYGLYHKCVKIIHILHFTTESKSKFESIYNNGYCNIRVMRDVNNVRVANNIRLFGIPPSEIGYEN